MSGAGSHPWPSVGSAAHVGEIAAGILARVQRRRHREPVGWLALLRGSLKQDTGAGIRRCEATPPRSRTSGPVSTLLVREEEGGRRTA